MTQLQRLPQRRAIDEGGAGASVSSRLGIDRASIEAKLMAVAAAIGLALVATGWIALTQLKTIRVEDRESRAQAVVDLSTSVLQHYEELERSGTMTREEAQTTALEALRAMRYGDDDYVFVINDQVEMVMHPIKPELDGTDVSGTEDPNGVRLFIDMVNIVAKDGAGLVPYDWPKPGFDEPQPKISYVSGFSPWGWIVGSGIYVSDVDAAVAADRRTLLIGGAITLVALIGGVLVMRSLLGRLRRMADVSEQIAGGDLSVEPIPVVETGTAGRLATSFNAMIATLGAVRVQADRIADGNYTAEHDIPGDLGHSFDAMRDSLSGVVERLGLASTGLSGAANELIAVVERIGDTAQVTAAEANSASTAGDDVSARVATVASAIEEMNATIREVATRAMEAASVATDAVSAAERSSVTIGKLGESSEQIGDVIKVINSIAEQTNLLALNATIEAARAGEAGKGFAVVANEVKDLADQTARATQEIAKRIEAIQADTASAIEANALIGETINRIDEISTAIASAVEEQSVTTSEIGLNVEETALSSQGIANSITDVARAADQTTQSVQDTRDAVDSMRRISSELTELVANSR